MITDTNERTHIQTGTSLMLARESIAHTLGVPVFEETDETNEE